MNKKKDIFLGKRVQTLREKAGLSQKELADKMGLSRSTISQIENADRSVYASELKELANLFNLTTDQFLNFDKEIEVVLEKKELEQKRPQIRIDVPRRNIEKFKEVLLYILNCVGSKPHVGETVIYKLLYFIDFNFYETYEEHLVGAVYIKNKYGPTPTEFKKIVEEMIREEDIIVIKNEHFKFPQTKYLPLREADLTKLGAHEKDMIDRVLEKLSNMNAKAISEYSHGDVPWLAAEEGEPIDYESVFYRTQPYSVRSYDESAE